MRPLMPKATAVWLIDNTTLTFDQVADFTGLHPLEVSGIADGEVAVGIKGFDPIANNQLTREEIERCEQDPKGRLTVKKAVKAPEPKKKAPRYTPLSKRLDRPAAIAWLVRNHPELADAQISKLLGTTKQTIEAIRNRTHWNSANIQPVDPVALGLCRQIELDAAVKIAAERKAAENERLGIKPEDQDPGLMSTEQSLGEEDRFGDDPFASPRTEDDSEVFRSEPDPFGSAPSSDEDEEEQPKIDADALFNLPKGGGEDDEDDR